MLEKWKSLWSRLFGRRRRTAREERVLQYVGHRLQNGARLQEVVRDEYVRRMATEEEVRRMLADPKVAESTRGRMRHDLDLEGIPFRRSLRTKDRPGETNTGRGAPLTWAHKGTAVTGPDDDRCWPEFGDTGGKRIP